MSRFLPSQCSARPSAFRAGTVHSSAALDQYRQRTDLAACLIVAGLTATQFSIADPRRSGMLDVVGFDTAALDLMSAFARGEP